MRSRYFCYQYVIDIYWVNVKTCARHANVFKIPSSNYCERTSPLWSVLLWATLQVTQPEKMIGVTSSKRHTECHLPLDTDIMKWQLHNLLKISLHSPFRDVTLANFDFAQRQDIWQIKYMYLYRGLYESGNIFWNSHRWICHLRYNWELCL